MITVRDPEVDLSALPEITGERLNVRGVAGQQAEGYNKALNYGMGYQAISSLARGTGLTGGQNLIASLMMANVPGARGQARQDRKYLQHARAQDAMSPTFSFRQKRASVDARDLEAADSLVRFVSMARAALTSPPVIEGPSQAKVSSVLDKQASTFSARLAEAAGYPDQVKIVQQGPGRLTRAQRQFRYMTASPGKAVALRAGDALKDAIIRTETVYGPGNKVLGETTRVLPGVSKAVKLPLALLALHAMGSAYASHRQRQNKAEAAKTFNTVMDKFRRNPELYAGPGAELMQADPEGFEAGARAAFDLISQYAPTVARDEQLTAQYLTRLTPDVALGVSGPEYLAQVQDVVKLENEIQRAQPNLFDGVSSVVGRLLD